MQRSSRLQLALLIAAALLLISAASLAQPVQALPPDSRPVSESRAATSDPTPFDRRLAGLSARLDHVWPAPAASLLAEIDELRDFATDPASVDAVLRKMAAARQPALLADEAHYRLALSALHRGRIADAEAKFISLGFVRTWAVLGPFAAGGGDPEAASRPEAKLPSEAMNAAPWHLLPASNPQPWQDAAVNLPAGDGEVYVATALFAEQAETLAIRYSSVAASRLFVNGRQVFTAPEADAFAFDQHAAAVALSPGWNSLVLALRRSGPSDLRFSLRTSALPGGGLAIPAKLGPATAIYMPATNAAPADLLAGAEEELQQAPSSPAALESVGRLLLLRGLRTREARLDLETAARQGPTAERWLAVADQCADNICAFAALSAALQIEPGNESALVRLSRYYLSRRQLDKSRSLLLEALQRAPGDFVACDYLAEVLIARGLLQAALEQSEILERDYPDTPWLQRRLASRYLDLGLVDRAARLLGRAADGDSPELERLRFRLYSMRHDVPALRTTLRPDLTLAAAVERSQPQLTAPAAPAALKQFPGELESRYLADPASLAAAALKEAPAAGGNAVKLADVRIEHLDRHGLATVRQQQVVYLSTTQGVRDFSERKLQSSPATQQLRLLHARVYKRDGRVLEGELAEESVVADIATSMYYDVRARTVRFPALEKGDVVELDYRVSPLIDTNPYGDYFGSLVTFRSSLAEQLQRYVLIAPAQRHLNIVEERMPSATVTLAGDERIYSWEARNAAALPNEPKGPALTDVAPYVHVSTFQSWDELGLWYAQLVRPQFELDAALRTQAAQIMQENPTDPERIAAIHQFVLRNTHYVAMEFGIYSYKPYPVSQVYARRFGDCKDKAALMIALLRQAGIHAEMALVRTRRLGEVSPRATSVALFNHAIVYVPDFNLWLDGTAEYAGLHELPLDDQGAMALTVSAEGRTRLRHIPVTQPGDNYVRRSVRAQVLPDGRIRFEGVASTRGEDAPGLRREYETAERQRDAVRNALSDIFPTVRLDDVHVEGAHDLERPVTVEVRGRIDNFAGHLTLPLATSWMPRTYVQQIAPLASRASDLLLPAPWTTEEELRFELPAGATVLSLPADTVLETRFGSASLHFQRHGGEVVVHTSVQFRQLRITPADYRDFRNFCVSVERAFREEIKIGLRG